MNYSKYEYEIYADGKLVKKEPTKTKASLFVVQLFGEEEDIKEITIKRILK